MAWKYVVMQVGNREVPIIFPEHLVHKGVAQSLKLYFGKILLGASNGLLTRDGLKKALAEMKPVSAGTVTLDFGKPMGKSDSLGVRSRPVIDEELFENYEYTHGLVEENDDEGPDGTGTEDRTNHRLGKPR